MTSLIDSHYLARRSHSKSEIKNIFWC